MKRLKLLSFVLILFVLTSHAQKKIILWENGVPNSKPAKNYDLIVDTTGSWSFTRQITDPWMDVHLAPADKATGTAVIICPGGGYWGLAFIHEGRDVAKWLNSLGVSAFVLKYRLPDPTIMKDPSIGPLQDAQQAVRLIRQNAGELNINPDKIGIMGFSAGGHLAATASTHYQQNVYNSKINQSARPDFSILIYPVISMDSTITHEGSRNFLLGKTPTNEQVKLYSNELQVDKNTPPTFIVHSSNDGLVPAENSLRYATALKQNGVSCELHLYNSGGHGYGMGYSNNTESEWTKACAKWLDTVDF